MRLDDAYANGPHIPDGDRFPALWADKSAAFRARAGGVMDERYGPGPRALFDLFTPEESAGDKAGYEAGGHAQGTVIFVHGGYWRSTDKTLWSHLAAGPLARGWRVAMIGYDLCPAVSIAQITQQVAAGIAAIADRVPGPLRLTGHSAGGHLVARMLDPAVAAPWISRVTGVVPISPLSDLTPLLQTTMNADLGLDADSARAESPRWQPPPHVPVTVWVGGAERPAFLEQARWLGEAWSCPVVVRAGRHHFDIIAGLEDGASALTAAVTGPPGSAG